MSSMKYFLFSSQLFNGTFAYIIKTHNLEALCKRLEHFYTSVSFVYDLFLTATF